MSAAADVIRERPRAPGDPGGVAAPDQGDDWPLTVIECRPGWRVVDLGELWRARELLFFLTWRDIKVRYKQTALDAAWAVLQPLATMVVFALFLGRVAAEPGAGVLYPLFAFAGLLAWTFFSNAVASAGQRVVAEQNLVTKSYFPRLIIPLGAVGAALVDLAISFALLLTLMPAFGVLPGCGLLLAPLPLFGLVLAAAGVGTFLSALTVAYRDFRHVVPFLVQIWMFATPSIYVQADPLARSRWRLLMSLNPAQGLIANFRRAALGDALDPYSLAVSFAVGVFSLASGCLYFRSVERHIADII